MSLFVSSRDVFYFFYHYLAVVLGKTPRALPHVEQQQRAAVLSRSSAAIVVFALSAVGTSRNAEGHGGGDTAELDRLRFCDA